MSNKIVYKHLKPNGEIFYIGIGSKNRAYSKNNRNKYWKNIVNKYGYKIEIMFTNLTKEEVCQIETYLICYYGRKDLNTGILVNMTNGGEGINGFKHSEASRLKMKITNKNKTKKGKTCSKETKLKLSIINSNYRHTDDAKYKISLNSKRKQKIIDTSTGIIYNSIKDVMLKFNLKQSTLCSYLSGKRKNKTTFEYYKKYKLSK